MINVYCRIDGKLAHFHSDTDSVAVARESLNEHLRERFGSQRIRGTLFSHGPVLAVVPKPVQLIERTCA